MKVKDGFIISSVDSAELDSEFELFSSVDSAELDSEFELFSSVESVEFELQNLNYFLQLNQLN